MHGLCTVYARTLLLVLPMFGWNYQTALTARVTTLPDRFTVSHFFFETALTALAKLFCLSEFTVSLFWLKRVDGSHWVTLHVTLTISLLLVEVVLTALTELLCQSEFTISLLVKTIRLICTNMLLLKHLRSPWLSRDLSELFNSHNIGRYLLIKCPLLLCYLLLCCLTLH